MKRMFTALAIMFFVLGATLTAQDYSFRKGSVYIGPRLGIASVGNTGAGYALNGEFGMEGPIGLFGSIGYASFSEAKGGFSYDLTDIILSVGGNLHLDILKIERLDTYIGFNIGYVINSASNPLGAAYTGDSGNFLRPGGQVGARYHISPSVTLSGEAGWTAMGVIKLGFDIAF